MGDIFSAILTGLGGVTGIVIFLVLLAVIILAIYLGGKVGATDMMPRITRLAGVAVLAVEKLADNGNWSHLPKGERSAAKKNKALEIIELGLTSEGIKPNPTLMMLAGFAIESVLKSMETPDPSSDPDEEE